MVPADDRALKQTMTLERFLTRNGGEWKIVVSFAD